MIPLFLLSPWQVFKVEQITTCSAQEDMSTKIFGRVWVGTTAACIADECFIHWAMPLGQIFTVLKAGNRKEEFNAKITKPSSHLTVPKCFVRSALCPVLKTPWAELISNITQRWGHRKVIDIDVDVRTMTKQNKTNPSLSLSSVSFAKSASV